MTTSTCRDKYQHPTTIMCVKRKNEINLVRLWLGIFFLFFFYLMEENVDKRFRACVLNRNHCSLQFAFAFFTLFYSFQSSKCGEKKNKNCCKADVNRIEIKNCQVTGKAKKIFTHHATKYLY